MDLLEKLRDLLHDDLRNRPAEELIKIFQAINGLNADGVLGPVTARKVVMHRFCKVPDNLNAKGALARWDHTRWNGKGWNGDPANMLLNYHVAAPIPGWTMQQTHDAFAAALGSLSAVCAVDFVLVNSAQSANLLYNVGKIDGESNTLAWCELPYGPDTPESQLKSLIDNSEPWVNSADPPNSRIDLVRVLAHETGHGLGLEHGPTGALLAPYYDATIRAPQDWDKQQLQLRYGPRVGTTAPPVPPSNPNAKAVVEIRLPNGITYHGELEPSHV